MPARFTNSLIMESPLGFLQLYATDGFLSGLDFLDEKPDEAPLEPLLENKLVLEDCRNQLLDYFEHRRKSFELPLRLHGSSFMQKVWDELQQVPFGEAISYLQLARRLGDEKAVRAVGHANGKNPLPLIVPCHRVIGQNGQLTGYSGGIWRKKWLLRHEEAIFSVTRQAGLGL